MKNNKYKFKNIYIKKLKKKQYIYKEAVFKKMSGKKLNL